MSLPVPREIWVTPNTSLTVVSYMFSYNICSGLSALISGETCQSSLSSHTQIVQYEAVLYVYGDTFLRELMTNADAGGNGPLARNLCFALPSTPYATVESRCCNFSMGLVLHQRPVRMSLTTPQQNYLIIKQSIVEPK